MYVESAGAEKDIRQRKDEISCYLCPRREWKFQPPSASHMSGIWERLIRSVSKMMKAVLGYPKAFVGLETLRIVFAEVVTSLNSRPVTPVSDDQSDYEPLTPSHFLLQRQNFALLPGCFEHEDLYRRKQWRRAQFLADCFWKRWIWEYIPTLQQRQKWIRKKDNLKIGDVVLVVDNNSPRGQWLLGRIIKTFPGGDGKVCVAEIKRKNSTLTRPISKLCLLEASSCLKLCLSKLESFGDWFNWLGSNCWNLSFKFFWYLFFLNQFNSAKPHKMLR